MGRVGRVRLVGLVRLVGRVKNSVKAVLSAALVFSVACAAAPGPDTILVNGKVFTSNAQAPWAQAVAIAGDRITAVGDTATVDALARSNTRRIDLGGRTVVPGFNDAHTHITIAPPSAQLSLPFEPTLEQVAEAVRAQVKATPAGGWIRGEFGQTAWGHAAFTRSWLDVLAPNHPVFLSAFTGHGALLNSQALALIKFDDNTSGVEGGVIERDSAGHLDGRLEEYAIAYANQRVAGLAGHDEAVRRYRQYAAEARSFGITSTQLLGDALRGVDASKALVAADVPMRWRYFRYPIGAGGETIDSRPPFPPQPSPMIDMRGMKWVLDGTPIERLAFMRAPYTDEPSLRGRLNLTQSRIDQFVGWAYGSEDPLAVHAFGDAAIEAFVSAVERGGRPEVWKQKRPRIEHGDMLAPDLVPRVKALGMLVVQNPTHFTFPEIFLERYGKERLGWMQMSKSLLDAGIPLAIGSDGPISPFVNIIGAITNPTNPKEVLTREQAVTAYTAGSAFAEFKEREKGQIAIGMLADLAVLSADVFSVTITEMENIRSVLTMLGGRVVHETGVVR
jgi:predicted amidohydrolase YtcJ